MRTTAPSRAPRGPRAALFVRALVWFGAFFALSSQSACFPDKGTIGAVIAQDDDSGRLFLRDVPPHLAAANADLKPGDEILTIDGADVRFMSGKQIHAALAGDVDSTVKLTLVRDEQIVRATLKRTEAEKVPKRRAKSADSEP